MKKIALATILAAASLAASAQVTFTVKCVCMKNQ
jgi:hypothetical protein